MEVLNLNEEIANYEEKCEVIDGKIYDMGSASDKHQDISLNTAVTFQEYFKSKKMLCRAIQDFEVHMNNKNLEDYFSPDVSIFCKDDGNITNGKFFGTPRLLIEILSSNRGHDKIMKYIKYAQLGVNEYWIIDQELDIIEQYILVDGRFEPFSVCRYLEANSLKSLSEKQQENYSDEIIVQSFKEPFSIKLADIFDRYSGAKW